MNRWFSKIFLVISILCGLLTFFVPISSFGYTFSRNLHQGDSGNDVINLQKVLNSSTSTQIALTGSGSPGNETSFFGVLTKQAVIAFQELYRNAILVPAGLFSGTGFVGSLTRHMLESLSTVATTAIQSNNETASTQAPQMSRPSVVDIFQLVGPLGGAKNVLVLGGYPYIIRAGDILHIQGVGFTATNTVYFDASTSIANIISTTTRDLAVQVPSISEGLHQVWVVNKNGTSQKRSQLYIKVSEQTLSLPTISSISPTTAKTTDTITVLGSGFDIQDNQVNTSLGILKKVSSADGKTIQFKIADLPGISKFMNASVDSATITFSISTTRGKTNNYGAFLLNK